MLFTCPAFWLTVVLCAATNFVLRLVYRGARCHCRGAHRLP